VVAISELINFRDTQPTLAPVQRFHDDLKASPGMARSFIHYFTPVYPDASKLKGAYRPSS